MYNSLESWAFVVAFASVMLSIRAFNLLKGVLGLEIDGKIKTQLILC